MGPGNTGGRKGLRWWRRRHLVPLRLVRIVRQSENRIRNCPRRAFLSAIQDEILHLTFFCSMPLGPNNKTKVWSASSLHLDQNFVDSCLTALNCAKGWVSKLTPVLSPAPSSAP
uniref:Uncharacterized protein n=1 Tax=Knipowitschia caucasica TaxID=637954 RepID=A0AAV2LBA2_KNICA